MNKTAYKNNFKKIYKTCIQVLDLKKSGFNNLFVYASNYATESLNEIIGTDKNYIEISSYYTKNHTQEVIKLECMD